MSDDKMGLGEDISQEHLQKEIDALRTKNGDATCEDHKRATIINLMVSKKLIKTVVRLDEHLDRIEAKGLNLDGTSSIKTKWFTATGKAMIPLAIVACTYLICNTVEKVVSRDSFVPRQIPVSESSH